MSDKRNVPELVTALEELRDTVLWHLSRHGLTAADTGLLGVIEDADKALAAAKGEKHE